MRMRVKIKFSTPLHHTLQYGHQTFKTFQAYTFLLHLGIANNNDKKLRQNDNK